MAHNEPSAPDQGGQVINFRRRVSASKSALPGPGNAGPIGGQPGAIDDDLSQYARDDTPDDYRHRMITNVAALAFLALLVAGGLWVADTMASMRRNQDCVLAGRRNCAPVEVPAGSRY